MKRYMLTTAIVIIIPDIQDGVAVQAVQAARAVQAVQAVLVVQAVLLLIQLAFLCQAIQDRVHLICLEIFVIHQTLVL